MTNTLIVGASLSGLATAACLHKHGIDYTIIEKHDQIATPWRKHYDRLHLHTHKGGSNLPHKKFGKEIAKYPGRIQVIEYLEEYQKTFDIHPIFNTEAIKIVRQNDRWVTETTSSRFESRNLIMATGAFSKPKPFACKGLETFPGKVIHSSEYKTGKTFQNQQVLVVGFGNSACEIAIDLYEQGAIPAMAVRSPVNIVPRDILGIPILQISQLLSLLKPATADKIARPIIKMAIGDITKLGIKKMPYGPLEGIAKDMKAPVLDIGTVKHLRKGHIRLYDDIDHIEDSMVHFKNNQQQTFDAIVAAIGFYRDYADILQVDQNRFDDLKYPTQKQRSFGKDGLYFCGYWISPTGQIREITKDAKLIADHIKREQP